MPAPEVTFVLANLRRDWPDLSLLDEDAIAAEPHRFVGGRNSWIAQGFLRLRAGLGAAGHVVRVAERPRPGTICVVHRDDLNAFGSRGDEAFLVVVRADRAPVTACDLAVVQNGVAVAPHERFLPLWPQPGLIERDRSRGARIRTIVYMGRDGAEPGWFATLRRSRELAARGLRFEVRTGRWHDYRDVDLVVAARDDARAVLDVKPATKVYNGWLAGVPVLAAPEPAYLEQARGPLDFIVVRGERDVLDAVELLRSVPALYEAMVRNGRARGADYDVDATRARWLELFRTEVVPAFVAAQPGFAHRRGWFVGAMLRQKIASRAWKARVWFARARIGRKTGRGRSLGLGMPVPHTAGPAIGVRQPRVSPVRSRWRRSITVQ